MEDQSTLRTNMATDNEQQGEILLGNKQLLSIFFVVVVLLGVAFTIGYMIGKNTATVSATSLNPTSPANPVARRPERSQEQSPPPEQAPQEQARVDETPAPATEPTRKPKKTMVAPPTAPVEPTAATAAPGTGTYLQVAALKRQDADHIVKVLRDRGYPALLGESPKEGLFRVLVGPFKDMPDVADTKQKLRASGFESIVAR